MPTDSNTQKLLTEGVKLHELGIQGDKNAVKKAYDIFKKLNESDPQNLVVEAYLGSVTSLLGRDSVDPNQKLKLALQGLKILDKVISKDPNNIETRSIRAYVNFNLPEMFFHRTASAIEDFKSLIYLYEHDNKALSEEFYWQILYDLGVAYKRLGKKENTQDVWAKLLKVTKNPKILERLKNEKF
jgi:tetratricopeptide (TPR) repeat protein